MPSGNVKHRSEKYSSLRPLRLTKLSRSFYTRPTMVVARELLGCYVVRDIRGSFLVGRIVEVEAYLGKSDPASHAYRGKTPRNSVMFRRGGYLYVYFTYGMHFCANVVTGTEGIGNAVLIRAVEPVSGIRSMKRRRTSKRTSGVLSRTNLCNGPAKLCQAFDIGRNENGSDLCGNRIWLASSRVGPGHPIGVSRRVGINHGKHHLRRFFLRGSEFVSRGKPSF